MKNKATPESRAFWAFLERTARRVARWPRWKRRSWYETSSTGQVTHRMPIEPGDECPYSSVRHRPEE